MTRDGTIRKAKDHYEIVFERRLEHPPERVWAMLTDPSRIPTWYVRTEIEASVGGRIVEHHDHVGLDAVGRVTRFEPPRVFEHTWWEDEDDDGAPTIVRWELFPDGAGTRLVLTNRFTNVESAAGTLAGWNVCLDVLEDVLGGGDPAAHAPPAGTFTDGQFTPKSPGRGAWARFEEVDEHYKEIVERHIRSTSK